jgi:hypothetical protein
MKGGRYLLVDAMTTTLSLVVRSPSHSCSASDTIHHIQHTQHTGESESEGFNKEGGLFDNIRHEDKKISDKISGINMHSKSQLCAVCAPLCVLCCELCVHVLCLHV